MKATELQIGDWIIFHDSGYASDGTTWEENRVCQIDSIDEDVRVKWYDESGCKEDWPHVSTMLLSPIPLTPEILEKNGFETDDGAHFFIQGQDNILELLLVELPFDGYTFDIVKTERTINKCNQRCYIDRCFASIDYVHQLQHALRLCGIEKEIVL